jgi:Oxidoreductase family, C-terminal alpha/beta domain/Oxidoreductase family, NAD-binding Rossmann fold
MKRRNGTRRQFIRGAAAAGVAAFGFPTIVPTSLRGADAPSKHVHLAAIGVGGRGFSDCWQNFVPLDDVRFLAVADCFASRRDRFAQRCNERYGATVCKPYADYREVLARDDIDGVVISTPDHWHVPVAFHAALAGKDIYCEKPLGTAMTWAFKLRRAVQEHRTVFQYGTQQRSMRPSQIAIDLVRNGYIGTVERCNVWCPALGRPTWGSTEPTEAPADLNYDRWIGPAPMKPYTKDRCTNMGAYHIYDYALGFIAGWGAHPLDLLQWGLNTDHTAPVKYEGTGKIAEGGLADTIWTWDVHFEYAHGVPTRFMSADVAKEPISGYLPTSRPEGTTFFGGEGWVSVSRGACTFNLKGRMVDFTQFVFRKNDERVYSGDSQARNFIDCMKSRRPTVNPFESAIRSDTISHLSDIAIRKRRTVRYDPQHERIIDDADASAMLDRPTRQPYVL